MKTLKYFIVTTTAIIILIVIAASYKFNYSTSQLDYDVGDNKTAKEDTYLVKPKVVDNFYKHVNHEWLKNTKIPESKPAITSFSLIQINKIDKILKNIVESSAAAKTLSEKQLKNMYASFINKNQRNKLGIKPIKPYLEAIDKADSHNKIALLMAKSFRDGIDTPFAVYVGVDIKNSSKHILTFSQSGIHLDRDHYLNSNSRAQKQRRVYTETLSKLFTLASYKDIDKRVENVINTETKLAETQFSPVQNRDIKNLYNIYNYKKLSTLLNNYPLDEMWNILNIPQTDNIVIQQVAYLQNLNQNFKKISVKQWQDYMRAKVLLGFADILSKEFEDVVINNQKQLGEIQELEADWKQGVNFVGERIAMITGRVYVENAFDEKSKKYVNQLVNSIKDEFKFAITNSTIFSEETKNKALYKLEKMVYNIGYPDKWMDFSKLIIKKDDLIGNVLRVNNFNYNYSLSKLNKKVDKTEWDNSPHKINAFYNPTNNKFVLLAGILNKPFFDINATNAQNYGGIGSVIAHEIGHGFDDLGAQFDADGNFKNWWTKKDKEAFNKRKNKLIAQINQYEPFPNIHPDGNLKIGEAIGDLNGAQISLDAYLKLAKKQGLDKKANPKKFFEQYAIIWREKFRHEIALQMITTDPHSLGEFRTNNTLRNMDAFYEELQIKQNDKMYRKPSERVSLW